MVAVTPTTTCAVAVLGAVRVGAQFVVGADDALGLQADTFGMSTFLIAAECGKFGLRDLPENYPERIWRPPEARKCLKRMALPAQRVDSHTWLAGLSVPFETTDPG